MAGYLRPVANPTGLSSWRAHTRRTTPSSEPGVDYYCPIGTPVVSPADGRVWMTGDRIGPATGRFVAIAFDDGRGGRALHLSRRTVQYGQRVRRGQIIGYSGASGYGEEDWSWNPATGGAHVHWTLWPSQVMRFGYDRFGRPYTIDHEQYVSTGVVAGEDSTPFPPTTPAPMPEEEDDDMKPTVHERVEDGYPKEWTRVHPDIGKKLAAGASRKDGAVTVYRGYEATLDESVAKAWARTHANGFGSGNLTSSTDRAGYIAIQQQATRLSVAIHG
jgi:murein DD-endopeptidase MepM/ murein hydrolase activator NlpD